MRSFLAYLVVTGLVAVANDAQAGPNDKEAIQGLWQAVEMEADGRKAPADAAKSFRILIKGDKLVFTPDVDNREHTYILDADAKPKAIDLTPSDGPGKGKVRPCAIYRLEGDQLSICLDKEGRAGKRPTEFKTTADDGFALIVLKRINDK